MALAAPPEPTVESLLQPLSTPYDIDATTDRGLALQELDARIADDPEEAAVATSYAIERFWNFCALCGWTQDEKDPDLPYKPLPPYAYVKEICDFWDERNAQGRFVHDRNAIIKSRQMQLSWLGCLFLLYLAITRPASKCVIISREYDSGELLIGRITEAYGKLPRYLTKTLGLPPVSKKNFSARRITFPNGSVIMVRPQRGGQAARSISPTAVLLDEAAFQDDIQKTITSVLGGQPLWACLITTVDAGPVRDIYDDRVDGAEGGPLKPLLSTRHHGLTVFKNRINGFTIYDLFYFADPIKATPEWKAENYAKLAPFGAWQWDREMEHDWDVAGGTPMFDCFDPAVHVAPYPYELDLESEDRPAVIVRLPEGQELRYGPCTLGFAVDHGTSHPCGGLWVARDPDGDLYAYRDYCVAGRTAGQSALALRAATPDAEYDLISPSYQVIDANAPLADRQDTQISDLYRFQDGKTGAEPIWPRLDHCKKPPGSVNRGVQEIRQMLIATLAWWHLGNLAAGGEGHWYFRRPSAGYPDGLPDDVIEQYAQGRQLLISPLCTDLVRELRAARWEERTDPTLNAPEKEVDRDNHVWKCLSYLLAEGFGGR